MKEHSLQMKIIFLLRKWADQGVRYGEFDEIGQEVVEELIAAYPSERLEELVSKAQTDRNS